MKTTVFSLADMCGIVDRIGIDRIMDDCIAALSRACLEFDAASHIVPAREGFHYHKPHAGLIEWMPAMTAGENVVVKIVGYHPENPRLQSLPTILSTALCFDTRNGHLMAVMDGNLITAVRTGAASAVASRVLAKADSDVLGLIGCGAQAISQLHALSRVFDLRQVLIYDTDANAQASFAQRTSGLGLTGIDIQPTPLPTLIAQADLVCTATSVAIGEGPVFADGDCKPWLHVNAIGSDFPGKVEVPATLLQRSVVCPDFPEQATREGECQQLTADGIGPDFVELVRNAASYAAMQSGTTVFDSTGWALEDYVTMQLFCDYGARLGYGAEVNLANVALDPQNPYAAFQVSAEGGLRAV